jgi:type IV pilus assembly protein PilA
MKSAKCRQCGFVGWAEVEFCKRCGAPFAADADATPSATNGSYSQFHSSYAAPDSELKNGIAIAALIVGIISFFTVSFLLIGAFLGITLGIIALVKANRQPSVYGGKGLAIIGLVTSALSVVILIPFGLIAAIAIPNILAARRAANEGSAIRSLQTISAAQFAYQAKHLQYGSIDQLEDEKLIESTLATGKRNGYSFSIVLKPQLPGELGGFDATAVPVEYRGTGIRSFYINETGVIFAANKYGAAANELDPPLDMNRAFLPPSSVRRNSQSRAYENDY